MIDYKKIKLYHQFNGDDDAFARSGLYKNGIINPDEWRMIRDLIWDIMLIKKGVGSTSFINGVHLKVRSTFSDNKSLELLEKITGYKLPT
jgi:hypothetical protein